MSAFLDRPPVSATRRIAQVFSTLIGLMVLFELVESIGSYKSGRPISDYLIFAGFFLFFVGCLVGWFRALPAALFILGGLLLIVVTALAFPGKLMRVYFFAIPAIPGFLYLYVYLVSKKAKRAHETQG